LDLAKIGEIILGSIPGVLAVLVFLNKFDRRLRVFMIEHEMLMAQYAKELGIDLGNLPTRSKGVR